MDPAPPSRPAQTPLAACLAELGAGLPVEVATLPLSEPFRERYDLERVLATGGMGVVFLGRHRSLGRPVALKFLAADSREMRARFAREAAVLASVSHPHVLRLLDHGEEGGMPYHAVEYLPGGTLAERIAHKLRLAPVEAMDVALQMLAGLAACHQRGVIHRDLKPENVLFGDDGTVRIADLGIAHDAEQAGVLTKTGMLLGTPRYMAPEQARGEAVTASADLYAVGAILYHMLAGHPPFTSSDPVQVLRKQILEPAPPLDALAPGLPAGLPELVHRALAKWPAERPASAQEFAERLAAIRSGFQSDGKPRVVSESGVRSPESGAGRAARASERRRRRAVLAAGIAVSPLVVAAAVLLVRPAPVARPSPTPAASVAERRVEPEAPDPEAALKEEAKALEARLATMSAATEAALDERRALLRRFLARGRSVLGPRCGRVLTGALARELVVDVHERAKAVRATIETSAYSLMMDGTAPGRAADWVAKQTEDFELAIRDLRDLAPAVFRTEAEPASAVLFAMAASIIMRPAFQLHDARLRRRHEDEVQRWLREHPKSWIGWQVEAERHASERSFEQELETRARAQELIEAEMEARGPRWEEHLFGMWLDMVARNAHALTKLPDRRRAAQLKARLEALAPRWRERPEAARNAIQSYLGGLDRLSK